MNKKSNKKALIALVAVAIVAVIGICIALAVFSGSDSNENTTTTAPTATTKATETTTQAKTEATTNAPAQTQAQSATTSAATKAQQDSNNETVIPNVKGTWVNEIIPNNASITVTNQSGNTIDITISHSNEKATKIATAKASISLDVSTDSGFVVGTGTFEYTDSFRNTGTGTLNVKENVLTLTLNEEYNDGSGWGISNASGDYILASY